MKLFKELRSIFALGRKTSFLYFLSEIFVFIIIAFFSALLVSFPIFYIGTSYSELYKLLGSFLIVLCLFVLFIYFVVAAFKRQEKGIVNNALEDNIIRAIYSFPYIFPLWFRSVSIFLLFSTFISFMLISFLKGITYLWLSFSYLDLVPVESLGLWIDKLLGILYLFMTQYYLFLFLLFSGFLAIIVLFSAKSIIQRYNHRVLIWFLFILELAILFSICYIFVLLMLRILF